MFPGDVVSFMLGYNISYTDSTYVLYRLWDDGAQNGTNMLLLSLYISTFFAISVPHVPKTSGSSVAAIRFMAVFTG